MSTLLEYALFLIPMTLLCAPVLLARWKSTGITLVDILAVLAPGWLWLLLVTLDSRDKSLSNYVELPLLAAVIFVGVLLRCSIPKLARRSPFLLIYGIAATGAVYLFFPGLPE